MECLADGHNLYVNEWAAPAYFKKATPTWPTHALYTYQLIGASTYYLSSVYLFVLVTASIDASRFGTAMPSPPPILDSMRIGVFKFTCVFMIGLWQPSKA